MSLLYAAGLLAAIAPAAPGGECQPHWDVSLGQPGANAWLYWLATLDDQSGAGPAVYAGGLFTSIEGVPAVGIAKWNGSQWFAMGNGLNGRVFAIDVFDDGSGPMTYAGGDFTASGSTPVLHVGRFNPKTQQWEQVGDGFDSAAIALKVWDDGQGGGPALYAGGIFNVSGTAQTPKVARWNGSAWSPVGSGMNDAVRTFVVFDDGDGPHLFCGGLFTMADGASANRTAKWTGTQWIALGSGLVGLASHGPRTSAVFDDGDGPALYFGGVFQTAGGQPANNIARWKNGQWSPVGLGVNERLVNMRVFDDGTGEKLFCGGWFTTAGGMPVGYTATWNGTSWAPLGQGVNTVVRGLAPWTPPGQPRTLVIGGGFTQAVGQPAAHIASWVGCTDPIPNPADINSDGSVNVQDLLAVMNAWGTCAQPCPPSCAGDIAPIGGDCAINVSDLLMVINGWS